jgi:chemotaxis protein MotB
MKAMAKMANFDKLKKLIEMTVTPEGLQIELMEDPHGTFFENGSAEPTPTLKNVLKILAPEAGKLPNPISIEGHTDSKPYSGPEGLRQLGALDRPREYSQAPDGERRSWPKQVTQVRGYRRSQSCASLNSRRMPRTGGSH